MARTTTTVIRTTSGTAGGGGARRATPRPRTTPRPRPKPAPKRTTAAIARPSQRVPTGPSPRPRTSSRTTTSRTTIREERERGTNWLPLLGLLGLAGLAGVLLWPRIAGAAQPPGGGGTPGTPGTPGNPGGPGGQPVTPTPGSQVHPPAGTRAVAAVTTGQTGLNLRQSARPGPTTAQPDIRNGEAFIVLESNIPEEGLGAGARNRWWRVDFNGRQGFIRAVGPGGEWNVAWPQGPVAQTLVGTNTGNLLAAAYMPAPQPMQAFAYDPYAQNPYPDPYAQVVDPYAQYPYAAQALGTATGCAPGTGCALHAQQPSLYAWAPYGGLG